MDFPQVRPARALGAPRSLRALLGPDLQNLLRLKLAREAAPVRIVASMRTTSSKSRLADSGIGPFQPRSRGTPPAGKGRASPPRLH
jgi:hypothetical protein